MNFAHPHQDILDFWFGEDQAAAWPEAAVTRRWFLSNAAQDADIAERFGERVEAALQQELVEWEREPQARLALILLLDQFTRNIFRGQARAFDGDHRAATLTLEGLSTGMDRRLSWAAQTFFLMPLMHAEDLELQNRGVAGFENLQERVPQALREAIAVNVRFAEEHRDLIARFGRFPHRNRALGRTSSAEEQEYLKDGKTYGQ